MATNQEKPGVKRFIINLLADDNAPDAESPYFTARTLAYDGTLASARTIAQEGVRQHRLSGYEIRINGHNGEILESVIGFFEDPDDEYQGTYHDNGF